MIQLPFDQLPPAIMRPADQSDYLSSSTSWAGHGVFLEGTWSWQASIYPTRVQEAERTLAMIARGAVDLPYGMDLPSEELIGRARRAIHADWPKILGVELKLDGPVVTPASDGSVTVHWWGDELSIDFYLEVDRGEDTVVFAVRGRDVAELPLRPKNT